MESYQERVSAALDLIKDAQKILIIPSSPVDADALGSALALKGIMVKMGKTAIINYSFERTNPFKFLPGLEAVQIKDIFTANLLEFDLAIFLDGGHLSQFYDDSMHREKLSLPSELSTINIDHHLTNEGFAKLTLHRLDASSTSEMIYDIFEGQVIFDAEIAFNLLAGISNDTGNFRHPNTTSKVLRTAADLAGLGASLSSVALNLYYTSSAPVIRFVGYLCQKIRINVERRYGYFVVSLAEWQSFGLDYDQFRESFNRALSDNLMLISEVEFVFAVGEKEPGNVKVSFRTRESGRLDLTVVAQSLGGGGHADSCAASIFDRPLESALEMVEKSIETNYDRMRINQFI